MSLKLGDLTAKHRVEMAAFKARKCPVAFISRNDIHYDGLSSIKCIEIIMGRPPDSIYNSCNLLALQYDEPKFNHIFYTRQTYETITRD